MISIPSVPLLPIPSPYVPDDAEINQSPDRCCLYTIPPLSWCWGSRRTLQHEIKKIAIESAGKGQKALLLEANGGPQDFPSASCIKKIRHLAQTHSIEYKPISSKEEIAKMVSRISQTNKYDTIWIRSHSNPNSMNLGSFSFDNKDTLLIPFLATICPAGTYILEGCHVGKGEKNLALHLSEQIPSATIYASSEMYYPVCCGVEMNEKGVHFKNPICYCCCACFSYSNSTRIYQNGLLQK